jgi:alpha-tubulin suppressor-like RCC1 family protein
VVVTTVPVITPAGGTYVSSVEVTISAVPGATVLYTTNGAEPTGGSAVYTAPFTLTTNTTVKAKAFATIGSSATVSADFVVKVADPVLSPASGKWYTQQPVSVSTSTTGATIYYTTDGSEPTTSSPAVSGGVVTVDRSMTLRVKAFKTGMTSSAARGRYAVTGDIRSGTSFMVALKADKTVWVWGRNESGQLGRGDVTPSSPQLSPLQVSGLTDIEAIAVGTSHVIALRTNGTLKAWGLNSNGQLGIGSTTNQSSPTDISTLSNVVEIAAGDNFSMARLANGQIWTWGGNGSYQLALGGTSTTNQTSPVQSGFTDDSAPVQMAAGQGFSLVLFADGTVKSAGLNASGSLGNNGTVNASTPQNVLLPAGITRIFAGRSETAFAVAGDTTSTLQLFGWGSNSVGALGLGTTGVNHKTPVLIDTGRSHVAVGDSHSIFGGPIGLLAGAGTSSNGELGVGVSPAPLLPRMAPIPGGLQSVALVGGTVTSAAIGVDGSVWTWGKGTDGALGHGNTTFAYTPKKIAGFALVVNPEVAVDTDGDGLSDSLEYVNGTDPMLADTNGDGVDDGAALLLGEKALTLDADGDGLTAGQEAIIGTDPNKADTDGDTVSDSVDAFPLDATRSTNPADANDHTPPVITLTKPVTAIPIS